MSVAAERWPMGFTKHLVNGIISTVISVAVTAVQADGDEWSTNDLLLSVAVSAFLSGFFTSYFAKPSSDD
jgi:hypothetical protein